MKPEIIYEDKYIIACIKPCGVPSQGDKTNDMDMVSLVQNYLFDNSDSDEEPYTAVIHRLDKPVGGIGMNVFLYTQLPYQTVNPVRKKTQGNLRQGMVRQN